MFKRPEELILVIIAILWVVLSYLIANYFGSPYQTILLITALTLLWAILFYMVWQRGFSRYLWPIFLGLLVVCWWPLLIGLQFVTSCPQIQILEQKPSLLLILGMLLGHSK